MVDYFDANAATNGAAVDGAVNGTAQAAANDDGMDEISVSTQVDSSFCSLTFAIVIERSKSKNGANTVVSGDGMILGASNRDVMAVVLRERLQGL